MKRVGMSRGDVISCLFAILQAFRIPHLASVYFIICVVGLLLICGLKYFPKNTTSSRVFAFSSGCAVVAIGAGLLFVDDLDYHGVLVLSMIAIGLCISLWNWNDARIEANVARDLGPLLDR